MNLIIISKIQRGGEKTMAKRKYPKIYEKIIPIALIAIALLVVVLLAFIVIVLTGIQ